MSSASGISQKCPHRPRPALLTTMAGMSPTAASCPNNASIESEGVDADGEVRSNLGRYDIKLALHRCDKHEGMTVTGEFAC